MKRFIPIIVAFALVVSLGVGMSVAGSSDGGGQPSAKATCQVGDISVVNAANTSWQTIMVNEIKTAQNKDLFIDVSLECGLYTRTLVKSKGGQKDTSTAEAAVKVRVLVDGEEAHPGPVVFGRRLQEVSAEFMGILTEDCIEVNCVLVNSDIYCTVEIDEECIGNETLELILDTMDAASFNFIAPDLDSKPVHVVEVQAMMEFNTQQQQGESEAYATIGKGSVTIEEVRMIKDEDYALPTPTP